MDEQQEVLKELLKLKLFLVQKLNSHTFAIMTQDLLDKVNEAINRIQPLD
jgi:predicted small metal-binding protein